MQNYFKKKHKFFSFFILLILQSFDFQGQSNLIEKADSLFKQNDLILAADLYEKGLNAKEPLNKESVFLKLAYCYEKLGNSSRTIFNLSRYYLRNPSPEVLEKINTIATENNFDGYYFNDFNFLIAFYLKWFNYLLIVLILIGFYLLYRFYLKRRFVTKRHFVICFAYLFIILVATNIPAFVKSGIVNKEIIFLRTEPSSASNISEYMKEGTRITILDKKDIWIRILWKRKFYFIKETDLYIID